MLNFYGYVIALAFFIYLLHLINKGPYIFGTGTVHYVNIKDLRFNVEFLDINRGDTVEFRNYDQIRHSIVNTDMVIPNSGILYEYDTYKYTFYREGRITFKSSLYDNMNTIQINVTEVPQGQGFYKEMVDNTGTLLASIVSSIVFYVRRFIRGVL